MTVQELRKKYNLEPPKVYKEMWKTLMYNTFVTVYDNGWPVMIGIGLIPEEDV